MRIAASELAQRVTRARGVKLTERKAREFLADFERDGRAEETPDGWRLTDEGYAIGLELLDPDELKEAA